MWTCERCGRSFRSVNQAHSCNVVTIADHLAGKPAEICDLFEEVRRTIDACGPVRLGAVKGSIWFARRRNFVVIKLRADRLILEFLAPGENNSPRIRRSLVLSAALVAHTLEIADRSQIDEELRTWLREAWRVAEP